MKILMVEDSVNKYLAVKHAINPDLDSLDDYGDLTSCMGALKSKINNSPQNPYDVLICDMNIPIASGRLPHRNCGLEMLEQLQLRGITFPSIVLYSMDPLTLTDDFKKLGVSKVVQYTNDENLVPVIDDIRASLECDELEL